MQRVLFNKRLNAHRCLPFSCCNSSCVCSIMEGTMTSFFLCLHDTLLYHSKRSFSLSSAYTVQDTNFIETDAFA